MDGFFVNERVAIIQDVLVSVDEQSLGGLRRLTIECFLPKGTVGTIRDQRSVPTLGWVNVVRFHHANWDGFVYLADHELVSAEGHKNAHG